MMTKWKKSPPELMERFNNLLPADPRLEPRKMFGYLCCFTNTHLFFGLHQANMILRLPEEAREKFMRKYKTQIFEPMPGHKMKEYVVVPVKIKDGELKPWIFQAIEFVMSLQSKVKKKKR